MYVYVIYINHGRSEGSTSAHSARYDAEQTALLFCEIVNKWNEYSGMFKINDNDE